MFKSRYSHGNYYWGVIGFYALAKLTELTDHQIYELNGYITGHTIKHLVAALAPVCLLFMLNKRRGLQAITIDKLTKKRNESFEVYLLKVKYNDSHSLLNKLEQLVDKKLSHSCKKEADYVLNLQKNDLEQYNKIL